MITTYRNTVRDTSREVFRLGTLLNQKPFKIPLVSTGTGVEVSTLGLTSVEDTTISIDGNAYFYDNLAGTVNQNQTRGFLAGAARTFYLKVLSGSANITIKNGKTKVISFNPWTSSTNAAKISGLALSDLPSSLISFGSAGSSIISGALSDLPSGLTSFYLPVSATISGELSDLPSGLTYFNHSIYNIISGVLSNLPSGVTYLNISHSNLRTSIITTFNKAQTLFNISNQGVPFPTSEIDKLLKALADWYQVNAPTANCTFNLSGANMGIPTGGASNVDIARLVGYYTAAAKTATVVVRTS